MRNTRPSSSLATRMSVQAPRRGWQRDPVRPRVAHAGDGPRVAVRVVCEQPRRRGGRVRRSRRRVRVAAGRLVARALVVGGMVVDGAAALAAELRVGARQPGAAHIETSTSGLASGHAVARLVVDPAAACAAHQVPGLALRPDKKNVMAARRRRICSLSELCSIHHPSRSARGTSVCSIISNDRAHLERRRSEGAEAEAGTGVEQGHHERQLDLRAAGCGPAAHPWLPPPPQLVCL